MRKYDFDRLVERRGSYSYKWDIAENELPMWVADMDFEVAPAIKRAVMAVAEHGVFGYSITPESFFEAVAAYRKRRHGHSVLPSEIVFSTGVVASISSAVRKLTTPAENVLIQAPVYNIFYNSILNNGRNVVSSDLVYENGSYKIDFSDLEEKMKNPETTLMILCNPHNPVGRIWTREELAKIGELARANGVTVISDEIHCDLIRPGKSFLPFAEASSTCREISVSCVAASKSYNIAGLQSSAVISHNPVLLHKMYRGLNTDECGEPNIFAMAANIAAFTECDEWLGEAVAYMFENRRIAENYIRKHAPRLKPVSADATYLLWVDISAYTENSVEFCEALREKTGLFVNDGAEYGKAGDSFIRINLATQRSRIEDGIGRLCDFVSTLESK